MFSTSDLWWTATLKTWWPYIGLFYGWINLFRDLAEKCCCCTLVASKCIAHYRWQIVGRQLPDLPGPRSEVWVDWILTHLHSRSCAMWAQYKRNILRFQRHILTQDPFRRRRWWYSLAFKNVPKLASDQISKKHRLHQISQLNPGTNWSKNEVRKTLPLHDNLSHKNQSCSPPWSHHQLITVYNGSN